MTQREIHFHQTTTLTPAQYVAGFIGILRGRRELLSSMHQAGARLVAQGIAMTALVEEIAGKQPVFQQGS